MISWTHDGSAAGFEIYSDPEERRIRLNDALLTEMSYTDTGGAADRSTSQALGNAALVLVITSDGFERTYNVFTDDNGDFAYAFTPNDGESGVYDVCAVHPDLTDRPQQAQFTISKLSVSPTTIALNIPKNYEQSFDISVSAGEGTTAANLELVYDAADQPTGQAPDGIHVNVGNPVAELASGDSITLPVTLWADNTASDAETIILRVQSDENASWGLVTIDTAFSAAAPVLSYTPQYIETGVTNEETVTESLTLSNAGLDVMYAVTLSLADASGDQAPSWVILNADADLGDMAVGREEEISVTFAPGVGVASGTYTYYLRVQSENHATVDIGLHVSVTQSGIGNVLFKVSDIYTATLDENNDPIEGLANATITVQNQDVATITQTLQTDAAGEALFTDLASGIYSFKATADNHQQQTGRFWIKPGITTAQDVFLEYNLVTVEWEVNEIAIEDKYEILLSATYETSVPAPVLITEPMSINLPDMAAGDVYNGEFTLTNYGLIRADDLTFTLPADDANFAYELAEGLPDHLDAMARITVACRVTCIEPVVPEEEGTGGGDCHTHYGCIEIASKYECANGHVSRSGVVVCYSYVYGNCGGSGGDNDGLVLGGHILSKGGPASSGYVPQSTNISGVECPPDPPCGGCDGEDSECCFGAGGGGSGPGGPGSGGSSGSPPTCTGDTCAAQSTSVGSIVNTISRQYQRNDADLSVKTANKDIRIKRLYYNNQWYLTPGRINLASPESAGLTFDEDVIYKDGIEYESSSSDNDVFTHGAHRITKLADGCQWKDKAGNWVAYDANGFATSYGSTNGVVANLIYENGRIAGYADKNGVQMIWVEYDTDGMVAAIYDAANRRVEYGYANGLLTTVTDVLGHDAHFEYDAAGRITKSVDAAGNERILTYDDNGYVTSVMDENNEGYAFSYSYDKVDDEFYTQIKSAAGWVKEVWYDDEGQTRRVSINGEETLNIAFDGRDHIVKDRAGYETRKEYDEWGNLTRIVYPDGSEASFEYDLRFNKRTKEINEKGIVTEWSYDGSGNLIEKIEASGTDNERTTEYTYDTDGNLTQIRRLEDADTVEAVTNMTYDDFGNMTSMTDPEGNVTTFTHDVMGNALTKEDPNGKIWTYTYDDAGRLKTAEDPLGNVTQIFYDELGNKIREVDAELNETTFEYDNRNNMIKSTDANGNSTLFEYTFEGKLLRQTDAEGRQIQYEYDLEGRLINTIDGNGNEISMEYGNATGSSCSSCSGGATDQPSRIMYPTFEKEIKYDKRGRKTIEMDVLSDTETYATDFDYDGAGNLVAKTDKEDKTTVYEYDELKRLIKVTDPLNGETSYIYDGRDNLIELTDASGNATWFEYDRNNRLVKEIRPMGEETVYSYDGNGNLEEKIDAKNQKTEYDYNDAGRLVGIRYYAQSGDAAPVKTVAFGYDNPGNLISYNDGTTSAVYDYDDLNQKISETVNFGAFSKANAYTYYKNGLKQTLTGPDGISYGYFYNDNNQLAGVQIPNLGFVSINEYNWTRPASMTLPGGSVKTFEYDPFMRIKQITAKDPGQNVLMDYQYTYDKMDNITAKATEHGNYDYGYDDLYRLTGVDNPDFDDEDFTYDPVGNRLTSADIVGEWTYNENNELETYDGISYVYDDNGNMTEKSDNGVVTKFFYNVEDRLERVEDGSGNVIATYYYDPFGRRLWKDVSGTRTYFHYADEGLVGEYDAAGAEIKTYGWKPGSTWSTDPLFMKVGSQYYFYHNDNLGTPQKMTATNGAVVWAAKYESFGKAAIEIEAVENNLRFAGHYADGKTGMHYNRFRYYNPNIGRYLAVDPKGLNEGINLYNYTMNNPSNLIDPSGLSEIDDRRISIKQLQNEINDIPPQLQIYSYEEALKNKLDEISWHIVQIKMIELQNESLQNDNSLKRNCENNNKLCLLKCGIYGTLFSVLKVHSITNLKVAISGFLYEKLPVSSIAKDIVANRTITAYTSIEMYLDASAGQYVEDINLVIESCLAGCKD